MFELIVRIVEDGLTTDASGKRRMLYRAEAWYPGDKIATAAGKGTCVFTAMQALQAKMKAPWIGRPKGTTA